MKNLKINNKKKRKIVCVIPVRGSNVSNIVYHLKNWGKPLIFWSIDGALKSKKMIRL